MQQVGNADTDMAHTTNQFHPIIAYLTAKTAANIVTQPFSLQYRLHTALGRETWAKLWYCCRALDESGRGYVRFPIEMFAALTGGDEKSIYRWLQQGERWGAFRRYSCKKNILSIWLGSLSKTCTKLNLKDWGAVSVQNLLNLRLIRPLTTATLTQKLQQQSRYAASRKIKPDWRKDFGAPHPNEFIPAADQPSLKSPMGEIPCLLHVSESRVFVSKGFTAFGASQKSIGWELGIRPITVQRHQKAAGVVSRQLCQAKQEYAWIDLALDKGATEYHPSHTGQNTHMGYTIEGDTITFEDGIPKGSKKAIANSWQSPVEGFRNRFFRVGKKTYMAKCNVYREDLTLKAMWAARYKHRAASGTVTLEEKSPGAVAHDKSIVRTRGET